MILNAHSAIHKAPKDPILRDRSDDTCEDAKNRRMERLMINPELLELQTEEGQIFHLAEQLLNYIYDTVTLDRHHLAKAVVEITGKCMSSFINDKLKVNSLEEQVHVVNEEPYNCLTTEEGNEEAAGDLADEPQTDQTNHSIKHTVYSHNSEYEIQAMLGSGTGGFVVQCWKKPANKIVALKIIKDTSVIAFAQEELKILESLKALGSTNFNIANCNEAFMCSGHLCLEFEKLDISLSDYMTGQGVLPLQEIRPLLHQITVALCFLDHVKVLHADLKPVNIMLVDHHLQPLKLQVIDFGLAHNNPEHRIGQVLQSLWYRAPEVLLGAPFRNPIDVWSLGCIAAEMLLGTPLFPASDENDMVRRIVSTVGLPPDDMLLLGCKTQNYFQERSPGDPTQGWTLKAPSEGTSPNDSACQCTQNPHTSLDDLLKDPSVKEDDSAEECDRRWSIDLVEKMLNPSALKRIKPLEILCHPFITMSHLKQPSYSSYLESSIKCMEACNHWTFHRAENVEPPSSSTASTNNHESLTGENPRSELTGKKQHSAQHNFVRGKNRLSRKRHWEDSDFVSRPLEENADELQCTSSDCYFSPRKRIKLQKKKKRKHEG